VTLADLADQPRIGWSEQVPKVFRDFWSADPQPDGSRVRFSPHSIVDYESALPLIAMGQGIQLPPDATRRLYPRHGVSYVDVTDPEPWTAALCWLPRRRGRAARRGPAAGVPTCPAPALLWRHQGGDRHSHGARGTALLTPRRA
jgi:DNA-binding transcriptional LysR family regulator